MKPTVLALMLSACLFSYAQNEEHAQNKEVKLENYVSQCDALAKSLVDKNLTTDITSWYEGSGKELAQRSIQELEYSIDRAPNEISHYLMILNTEPLIFSLHFYESKTKAEFGHMFIFFFDQENSLVDDIQFVSKAYYDMNSLELSELKNAPDAVTSSDTKD